MFRRDFLAASVLSAGSLATGALGTFGAWHYRRAAIAAESSRDAIDDVLATARMEMDRAQTQVSELQAQVSQQERELKGARQQIAQLTGAQSDEGRQVVARLVGLGTEDSIKAIAYKLTDALYQNNADFSHDDHFSTPEITFAMTMAGQSSNLCSGLSQNLHWALNQFAIPNRYIILAAQTFLDGKQLGDTHELIEAQIDGRLMVLDPTFSVTYCDGDDPTPIDAKTMADCAKAGTLKSIQIGKPRAGLGLADYYMPIDKLTAAMQATGGPPDFYQVELPYPGWFATMMAKYNAA